MNYRELHNIECIELPIRGAGEYFFPRPQFANKKIDGVFFENMARGESRGNLYISIYSIEKKPLYVNIPLVEFNFDNINNNVGEIIDWELSKITYTGSSAFTLYSYFSMEEKPIKKECFQSLQLKCKCIRIDVNAINNDDTFSNSSNAFTADDAAFFQNKKIRMISCSEKHTYLLNLFLKSGNTFNKIPNYILTQIQVGSTRKNLLPFIMNDYIDLDRSSIEVLRINPTSDYIDLMFFYE